MVRVFYRPLLKRLKSDWKGALFIASLLMVFWLLISASLDWQHIVTGILLVTILTVFWVQLTIDERGKTLISLHQLRIFLRYIIFLGIEIIKANFVVASIVLNPKMPISPGLIVLKIALKRNLPRVFYANSITLTPGTITVDLEGDRLLVHGMTKDHAFGVRSWYLYDIMKDLEEGAEE